MNNSKDWMNSLSTDIAPQKLQNAFEKDLLSEDFNNPQNASNDSFAIFNDKIENLSLSEKETIQEDIERQITKLEDNFFNEPEEFYACLSLKIKQERLDLEYFNNNNSYMKKKDSNLFNTDNSNCINKLESLTKLNHEKNDSMKLKGFSLSHFELIESYDENFIKLNDSELILKITLEDFRRSAEETTDQILTNFVDQFLEDIKLIEDKNYFIGIAPTKILARACVNMYEEGKSFILRKNRFILKSVLQNLSIKYLPFKCSFNIDFKEHFDIKTFDELRNNLFKFKINLSKQEFVKLLHGALGIDKEDQTHQDCKNLYISKSFIPTLDKEFLKSKLDTIIKTLIQRCDERTIRPKKIKLKLVYDNNKCGGKVGVSEDPLYNYKEIYEPLADILDQNFNKPIKNLRVDFEDLDDINEDNDNNFLNKRNINQNMKNFANSIKAINFVRIDENDYINNISKTQCPVCGQYFDFYGNNSFLNRHIDKCLRGEVQNQLNFIEGVFKKRKRI